MQRERDPIPWRYCLLTLVCGLVLVGGFFFAARQHFSSITYGIKNSLLKKQKDELQDAQRQLLIAKEIALSPAEIKKAAKKIGLTDMTAANIEPLYATTEISQTQEKPKAEKAAKAIKTYFVNFPFDKTEVIIRADSFLTSFRENLFRECKNFSIQQRLWHFRIFGL